ncbi:AP2 domain-containing protein [Mammaliicoccus sp. D-M17]|uniref:AP2 domain-containing protein n=1 Tax=Mammaliicoccus sp. D-M17 TaxID=2898677 RepID=UPI001EFB823A|nr:AP2 domain-containing protein [Mammaliicoccus sp. D-M17]
MVKSIYLQDGEEIFVDDKDYERVNQFTWSKFYISSTRIISSQLLSGEKVTLARIIKNNSFQREKNNNFTKDNLVIGGNSARWSRPHLNGKSKYKGVSWNKKNNKWFSSIFVGGKTLYLGSFENEDEAAKAYNQAVLGYWEGNGYLNVIGKDNRDFERQYKSYTKQHISRSKSGYKGVAQCNKKFCTRIIYKNTTNHVAVFDTIHQAALAYNKCIIYLHGDDTILNDVPMTDELKEFIANWEVPENIKQLKEQSNE